MRRRRQPQSFTLTELLVATAITLLIVVVLFQVFATAARQWQSSDQRIDTFRDARAILQIMERDLSQANTNGANEMLKLSDPFSDFAKEVYAITPISNPGKSDLCTVGYYCAYDPVTHAFSLRRLFKDSDATFNALANSAPDYTAIYQKDTPPGSDEIAAAYVWDLKIQPGIGKAFVAVTTPSSTWNWLEIRFKSMSPAAGRNIRNTAIDIPTWFDPTSPLYKTFILPYEQQFITRVVLKQNL